ncbi:GFA family protein [Brucellaceae bacterium C25G]
MNKDISEIAGQCHCGSVKFYVRLTDGLNTARRCTCSYCRMRGAVAVSAQLSDIQILQGTDKLTLYQFNTKNAKHYFCSVCGIYTHHQRRSNPEQYGVNVACLEGLSPFDFDEVPVNDGVSHPSDTSGQKGGKTVKLAGVLRFIATETTGSNQ